MSCLGGFAKTAISVLSTIFFLLGVAFLTIVGIVTVEFQIYASGNLFKDIYLWAPVGVGFVVGALFLLCGVLGLGGVCCEKPGLLRAFSIMMFLLVLLEVTAGVLIYVYRNRLNDEVKTSVQNSIARAYQNTTSGSAITREALNSLQQNLKCCGATNSSDYTSVGVTVPNACCVNTKNCSTLGPFQTQGCAAKLSALYSDYATITFGVAVGFAVLQIIALVYSCVVGNKSEMV